MPRCAFLVRLAVLLGLVALSGCFDYTEEIKFDEKGAGKMQIVFDLGNLSLLEKMAAATIKKNPIDREAMEKGLPPGIKLFEFKEETKDERKITYITYEFDDLNKFAQWKRDDRGDLIFRNLSLTKVGDTWVFKRTLKAKDEEQLKDTRKHLSRSKIVFKLTGPGALVKEESNPQRIEGDNTCVWEGSFPELLEGKDGQGTEFKAQYFIGTPLWIKAVIGAGVLLIVVGLAAVVLRKKPAAPPSATARS